MIYTWDKTITGIDKQQGTNWSLHCNHGHKNKANFIPEQVSNCTRTKTMNSSHAEIKVSC